MALFPGLPDAQQRADVLVFLRTKSDNPPPLPEPKAPSAEKPSGEKPAGEAPGGESEVVALLATADPKQGEADAGLCKVCHSFEKGGPVMVGPDLYDVIGRKIASVEGFAYTPALKAHEGEWTYEKLDPWLKNPQAFAPGTMMAFPGVPDAKKRADIIAFLRTKSDSPPPLPEAAPAVAPAEEAAPPAEEAAPPAEEAPPAAEEAAPSEEAPAAEPEQPAAPEEAAPSEETPAVPEETMAPEEEPATEEPSMGEPPFANQPQPVVPEDLEKVIEETEDNPPAASEDTSSEPSTGEPPFANQPQPVYPDGPPEGVE
jgi:cytochrome c